MWASSSLLSAEQLTSLLPPFPWISAPRMRGSFGCVLRACLGEIRSRWQSAGRWERSRQRAAIGKGSSPQGDSPRGRGVGEGHGSLGSGLGDAPWWAEVGVYSHYRQSTSIQILRGNGRTWCAWDGRAAKSQGPSGGSGENLSANLEAVLVGQACSLQQGGRGRGCNRPQSRRQGSRSSERAGNWLGGEPSRRSRHRKCAWGGREGFVPCRWSDNATQPPRPVGIEQGQLLLHLQHNVRLFSTWLPNAIFWNGICKYLWIQQKVIWRPQVELGTKIPFLSHERSWGFGKRNGED